MEKEGRKEGTTQVSAWRRVPLIKIFPLLQKEIFFPLAEIAEGAAAADAAFAPRSRPANDAFSFYIQISSLRGTMMMIFLLLKQTFVAFVSVLAPPFSQSQILAPSVFIFTPCPPPSSANSRLLGAAAKKRRTEEQSLRRKQSQSLASLFG